MNTSYDRFFNGPACPIGCDYCMVTKVTARRTKWEKRQRFGLNKTLLFVNRATWEEKEKWIEDLDSDMFLGEYLGFEGISDPMWNIFKKDRIKFLEMSLEMGAKKVVMVTKFPVGTDDAKTLSQFPHLVMAVSITGLDRYGIEPGSSTKERIRSLENLIKHGIPAMALVHPYIHGLSDLSFLSSIPNEAQISFKGFRFNKDSMTRTASLLKSMGLDSLYDANEDEVLLGEDFIEEQLCKIDRRRVEFREWVHHHHTKFASTRGIESKERAVEISRKIFQNVNISSSEKNSSVVFNTMVQRRMRHFEK